MTAEFGSSDKIHKTNCFTSSRVSFVSHPELLVWNLMFPITIL